MLSSAAFSPELVRTLRLPPPQRSRSDDRIVELVLQAFSVGAFAGDVDWLPQQRSHVEAVARNASGLRLAVEHTRIGAFEKQLENEGDLDPIARRLENEPEFDLTGCAYRLLFYPGFLSKLLRRYRDVVLDELLAWALRELPDLEPRRRPYAFSVPISVPGGKRPRIELLVEVAERNEHVPPITVKGFLPDDPNRLRPVLARALDKKLPKLVQTDADQRMLVLEKRTLDAETALLQAVLAVAEERRAWAQIDWLVLADAFALETDGALGVQVWDVKGGEWKEFRNIQVGAEERRLVAEEQFELGTLAEQARAYVAAAKAKNTLRGYDADWRDFSAWCAQHGRSALPAEPKTVALYLADRATTLKTSSLSRRLTAIARRHQALGYPSPASMQHATVSEVWKGIQRTKGTVQQGKTPLLTAHIRQLIEAVPDSLQGARDRALLLVGFAGGFRRSELAALEVPDLKETEQGIVITLRRSKTDPAAQGRPVALPYGSDPLTCPVRALRSWLEKAAITEGPLFRAVDQFDVAEDEPLHPDSIAFIVKRAAERIGLEVEEFAGHSLRAGLATQAAMNGASELAIMKQTGHRSLRTVRKYIREGSLFRDNAATRLGL
jgi:site-specific recombinase XerD